MHDIVHTLQNFNSSKSVKVKSDSIYKMLFVTDYFWTWAVNWRCLLGYKYADVSQNKFKEKIQDTLPKAALMLISSRKWRSHWFMFHCEIVIVGWMGHGLWPRLLKCEHFYHLVSLSQPETPPSTAFDVTWKPSSKLVLSFRMMKCKGRCKLEMICWSRCSSSWGLAKVHDDPSHCCWDVPLKPKMLTL